MGCGGAFIKETIDEIKSDVLREVLEIWDLHPKLRLREVLALGSYVEIDTANLSRDEFDPIKFLDNDTLEKYACSRI
jgi:hypothetical protein